jgi:multidrug efflux pump subunit AcrA (membrane-fusion protein)
MMTFPKRVGIGVAIAGTLLIASCGKKEEVKAAAEAEPATPVMVEKAVSGAIDHVIVSDAILAPINISNVTSKINAPIKRLLVNRGDHVRAGQLIAELENADLTSAAQESKAQYDQSQANLQALTGATVPEDRTKAQADVQAAQQAYDTALKLYNNRVALEKEGALATKLVDDAKVAMVQAQSQLETAQRHLESLSQVGQRETVRSSEAQVAATKAHYESALVQAGYAQIRSPISGLVADRPLNPGELATSGAPIATIVDISQIRAIVNVPVKDAAAISVGRPARISGPDGDIPAKVTVVSPAVNASTTTVEVWVQAPNPLERLKPGTAVKVTIIAETIQNTLVVPTSALLNMDDGGQKVMVITDDKVAHERRVSVGVRQGTRVQILSGVQEGDQVVTSGGLGLEDKAKVTIQEAKAEDDDDDSADAPESDAKSDAKQSDGKQSDSKKETKK